MTKNIIICADDYSQNDAICEGIILLAQKNRVNAISCLVNSPNWHETHCELNPLKKSTYIGLHLNLTFGHALSTKWQKRYAINFNNLSFLLKQSYLGGLDKECVEAEICAQFDAFTHAIGANPDFIDGHEHIHQLPIIRNILLRVYRQKKLTAFCRNTSSGWQDFLSWTSFPKRQVISLLGGLALKRLLRQHAISANSSFAGIYDFVKARNYRHYFKRFLRVSNAGGLIMCHPGIKSSDLNDPLHQSRHHELNYFMSKAFLNDLNNEQCRLIQKPNCVLV